MTYVWFIGSAHSRTISGADWEDTIGSGSYIDTTWNAANGWSLPTSSFDSDQLDILEADDEFATAQATTPRDDPSPAPGDSVTHSNHAYYEATKDLYDAIVGGKYVSQVTRKVHVVTQSATPAINTDVTDHAIITGLAQAITSLTSGLTGTPVAGDSLLLEITDDGTGRALAFGTKFEASTVALPTTTVSGAKLSCLFFWNTVTSKWRLFSKA